MSTISPAFFSTISFFSYDRLGELTAITFTDQNSETTTEKILMKKPNNTLPDWGTNSNVIPRLWQEATEGT